MMRSHGNKIASPPLLKGIATLFPAQMKQEVVVWLKI